MKRLSEFTEEEAIAYNENIMRQNAKNPNLFNDPCALKMNYYALLAAILCEPCKDEDGNIIMSKEYDSLKKDKNGNPILKKNEDIRQYYKYPINGADDAFRAMGIDRDNNKKEAAAS